VTVGQEQFQEGSTPLPACFRDTLRNTLSVLLEAHDAADEFGWDSFRTSVSLRELQLHGGTINQLRWLLESGHVQLIPGAAHDPAAGLTSFHLEDHFLNPCRVVLTPSGAALARWYFRGGEPPRPEAVLKPRWDAQLRTLWLGSSVVKQFRVPAVNQEIVLQVFEEEGWPRTIDDPIPQGHSCEGKARLHNTIRRLNTHQRVRRLRFIGNGRGDGVSWEVVAPG
jgi:hypothetical protein